MTQPVAWGNASSVYMHVHVYTHASISGQLSHKTML